MTCLLLLLWTALGLCVGSFCNVLIFRLPRGEEFVKTPSHCMACGHRLHWYELLPVVSYLAQGGKCRCLRRKALRPVPRGRGAQRRRVAAGGVALSGRAAARGGCIRCFSPC